VADAAVLHQNRSLLLCRQLLERSATAQGVPNCPGHGRVADLLPRPAQQRLFQIRLVPQGVGAAQHRVLWPGGQQAERWPTQKDAHLTEKEVRLLMEDQQPDTTGIADIFVQHAGQPGRGQRLDQQPTVGLPERLELHEQPAIQKDHLAIGGPAALADVEMARGPGAHSACIPRGSKVQNGSSSR